MEHFPFTSWIVFITIIISKDYLFSLVIFYDPVRQGNSLEGGKQMVLRFCKKKFGNFDLKIKQGLPS